LTPRSVDTGFISVFQIEFWSLSQDSTGHERFVTVPELVAVRVAPLPPQPTLKAVAASKSGPNEAVSQTRLDVNLSLARSSGRRSKGNKTRAVAAPGRVSVKTAVTWYVPAGAVVDVEMVSELLDAE
jgi:hypothetical protein